jgi:phenylpropionate dioxygenase-like ring-hydroxylating dioxygenase large terminal subunit
MASIRAPMPAADPLDGWSLPAWVYSDPDYFAVEMARVIRPSWQIVCHVSDIPATGDWHTLDYAGESVIVVRGDDLVLRAFTNVCRHRGSRLVDEASGCARKLVCPYHAWTYELDGRLSGVPGKSEYPMLDMKAASLSPVELEIWHGFVFVRLWPVSRRDDDTLCGNGRTLSFRRFARGRPCHAAATSGQLEERCR